MKRIGVIRADESQQFPIRAPFCADWELLACKENACPATQFVLTCTQEVFTLTSATDQRIKDGQTGANDSLSGDVQGPPWVGAERGERLKRMGANDHSCKQTNQEIENENKDN
jgi:hypothetical protein